MGVQVEVSEKILYDHYATTGLTLTIRLSGETIPIRLFLGGFDLTPTFREVNKKYSTRYYLSLVLIDEGTHVHL